MHRVLEQTVHSIVWRKVTPIMLEHLERSSSSDCFVLRSEISAPNLYSSPINMDVRAWTKLTKSTGQKTITKAKKRDYWDVALFSEHVCVHFVMLTCSSRGTSNSWEKILCDIKHNTWDMQPLSSGSGFRQWKISLHLFYTYPCMGKGKEKGKI